MSLLDFLFGWLSFSFYRLWYPIVAASGFSDSVMVVVIAAHNMISIGSLFLVTAVGYLAWRRRGWLLSLSVFLFWLSIGLLFLGAYSQLYGFVYSFVSIFTHGWLEFSVLFYWVLSLRKTCRNCSVDFQDDWLSWKSLFLSVNRPRELFRLVSRDVKKAWSLTIQIAGSLWRQNLGWKLFLVSVLIFFSATVEIYVTPSIAVLFRT